MGIFVKFFWSWKVSKRYEILLLKLSYIGKFQQMFKKHCLKISNQKNSFYPWNLLVNVESWCLLR